MALGRIWSIEIVKILILALTTEDVDGKQDQRWNKEKWCYRVVAHSLVESNESRQLITSFSGCSTMLRNNKYYPFLKGIQGHCKLERGGNRIV
jgi:hypothetical protein